jgi:TetR/AcrR family transcriptional regulator, transcriptional repressor for nem operon
MGRPSDARKRLISAAIREIFAHSYASVSVDDLCAKAEVTKSSFYHFFPSKHDLALEALDVYWQNVKSHIIEPAFATEMSPQERILRLFDLSYETQRKIWENTGSLQGCLAGNLTLEMSSQDEAFRMKLDGIFSSWIGYIEQAIRAGVEQGAFITPDPAATARAVFAYMEGVWLLARSSNDPASIAQLRFGILSLLHAGGNNA